MPLRTPLTQQSSQIQPPSSKAPHISPPPETPVEPVVEFLHGIEITDPYRWLEDQNSVRTREWIKKQTAYTRAYLNATPYRRLINQRVQELLSASAVFQPCYVAEHSFFLRRDKHGEQPAICMRHALFGEEKTLIDRASRAERASTAVAIAEISPDGRFLAYSVRQGGTDHSALKFFDIQQNTVLPDRLAEGFCNGIAFAPDGSGFYYSHKLLGDSRPNYRAVFWHRFGSDQSRDQEVFVAGEEPNLFVDITHCSELNLLLFIVSRVGKQRNTSLYFEQMLPGATPRLLLDHIEGCFVPFFVRHQLFAYTDLAAPNRKIVRIDLDNPAPRNWVDVVPESEQRIQQFASAGDELFITRVHGFSTTIESFGLHGEQKESIGFPPHGTITLLNRKNTSSKLFFSYSSICRPSIIYCYEAKEKDLVVWESAEAPLDPSTIAVEEVSYFSKDGTLVPLLLAARKELLHSGPLPTFITGYGGFGNCVTPRFSAFATFLIEQGFLFAVPALRGGSELGEQWHAAGKRENRQKSIDDFIAATEWLLSNGRSIPSRVAIGGGSNAGLLVGAAITQRPDLFRAAICLGPLLDMVRYHLFDFAAGWADEYGSPEDKQDFHSLLAYSPYHHVREGVAYPAVMVISGDADTRCNPMHARKMAARLQRANRSGHLVILDYTATWGHTPVQPLSLKVKALTDRLAFICQELTIEVRRSS